MKRFIIFICAALITVSFSLYCFSGQYDPVLVVVLMVKNEEAVIAQTVAPFVQGGVHAFLIFDTGSTDNTIERVTAYFQQTQITNFVIKQEPFIDFSTSRNRALDLAYQYFPKAGFFIMPDAEWYIQNADQLLAFCKQELKHSAAPLYAVRAMYAGNCNDYDVPRLFKADSGIRFKDLLHEIPDYSGVAIKVPREILFDHRPSCYGDEKTHARTKRDIDLLLYEHNKDPDNARTLFYLAQSYMVLKDYHNAILYFKKRVQLIGFVEERFLALYRIAQLTEQLFFRNEATWQEAEDYYLQAFAYRPTRAEPLVHLANHYMHNNNMTLAFEYAQRACNIPYPSDSLSINKELYEFNRWQILARSAEHLRLWDISITAAQTALQAHPDLPDLHTIVSNGQAHQKMHHEV